MVVKSAPSAMLVPDGFLNYNHSVSHLMGLEMTRLFAPVAIGYG
jgi:hypothetical protein